MTATRGGTLLGYAILLSLLFNSAVSLYAILNREVPALFSAGFYVCVVSLCWAWINVDSRELGTSSVATQGHFVAIAWPLALLHHLAFTRGRRASLYVLVGILVWILTILPGAVVMAFAKLTLLR